MTNGRVYETEETLRGLRGGGWFVIQIVLVHDGLSTLSQSHPDRKPWDSSSSIGTEAGNPRRRATGCSIRAGQEDEHGTDEEARVDHAE